MHYVAGVILSVVFQLAHVVEDAEVFLPDESGTMKNTWAIHQLFTTVNFATKNKLISWLVGGLNFQIEHHLFPKISHVHYPAISKIVKETCADFKLTYKKGKIQMVEYSSIGSEDYNGDFSYIYKVRNNVIIKEWLFYNNSDELCSLECHENGNTGENLCVYLNNSKVHDLSELD